MVDFSHRINFLKPNIQIDYNSVSSGNYDQILNLLKKRYEINSKNIELFNGYSSAIYSILKFLKLKYCFIYSPCTLEYKKAATNLDYEVRLINRFENLFLPIKEQSVVVFANPSYLDGTFYNLGDLFEYWKGKKATIILDETLLDFCKESSTTEYLTKYDKIYIIKDFSNYYSNENLNISSIFSTKENIDLLRKYEPEDKLSIFDMKYLELSLKDKKFNIISNAINIKNRVELEKIFYSCKFVDFLFHSSSNSLLIKLKDINSKEFRQKLEKSGIKTYNCLKYDFIDDSFINIYVNSKDNIEKLKGVLDVISK